MEKLSVILEDLIFEKSISLRSLEKETGVSANSFSKYLHGTTPTIFVAIKICNYFCCSLDYLCGLDQNRKYEKLEGFNLNKFISRYEEILKANGTSHYKFSKAKEISESCLRHWKYGQNPSLEILCKIAEAFDISLDYLTGLSDKK